MTNQDTLPSSIIIIGAGVFGLSTALAIAKRHPRTKVTVVDRLVPPVADGESVDTTRCIRSGKIKVACKYNSQLTNQDYDDPVYGHLAKAAQKKIEEDPELNRHLFKQGMTFVGDGKAGQGTDEYDAQWDYVSKYESPKNIEVSATREEIYQRIHGKGAKPPSTKELGREPRWNKAYCNLDDAFIDAKECIQVVYDRCQIGRAHV